MWLDKFSIPAWTLVWWTVEQEKYISKEILNIAKQYWISVDKILSSIPIDWNKKSEFYFEKMRQT